MKTKAEIVQKLLEEKGNLVLKLFLNGFFLFWETVTPHTHNLAIFDCEKNKH